MHVLILLILFFNLKLDFSSSLHTHDQHSLRTRLSTLFLPYPHVHDFLSLMLHLVPLLPMFSI